MSGGGHVVTLRRFAGSAFCALFLAALAGPAVQAAAPAATDKSTATSAASSKPKLAKTATSVAAAPWTGSWTGSIEQVGRGSPYPIEITLTAKGGETSYPGQNCVGKLVRVAASGDYAFFLETITSGKLDPATKAGCLDGSLTLHKGSAGLVMTWMTGYNDKAVVAYGPLQPKAK